MRVLALDTTTVEGSVAIIDGDRVLVERQGDAGRSHAERLPGDLEAALAACGMSWADVDLFAVASGPGSFTGLRIGIATVQGLSFVTGKRVVPVAALDAMAHAASADTAPGAAIAAWMNAQRREVFAALYAVADAPLFDAERLTVVAPPSVGDPAAILARWRGQGFAAPAVFVGGGAALYADTIAGAHASASVRPAPALAAAIGRLAVARAGRGEAVDPAGIQPLYVRRPDAELDRDRRLGWDPGRSNV